MTGRDWKGGLVPYLGALFGRPVRVAIPAEFADEAALLAYLGLGAAELKKIWYYRGRMYRHFSIAKPSCAIRPINTRIVNAPRLNPKPKILSPEA